MFDIGFSELLVIGVVALVVIGPERLPAVARTAGALLGRARRYVDDLKTDIQNEVDLEEMERIKSTFYHAAESIEHSAGQAAKELEAGADALQLSIARQAAAPAAVDAPGTSAQMELWHQSIPAAGPAAAPGA